MDLLGHRAGLLQRSLLTALVPLLFLGSGLLLTFWWFGFNHAESLVKSSAKEKRNELQQRVWTFITARQQKLALLARRTEMRSGDLQAVLAILRNEEEQLPGVFESLYYNSLDGMAYPSSGSPFSVVDRPYFQDVLQGRGVVGEALVSRDTGARILLIVEPVRDGEEVVGAIAGSLVLDEFLERITSAPSSLPSGMVGVIAGENLLAGPPVLAEIAKVPEASSETGARIEFQDRSVFGWVAPLHPAKWSLVVAFDESEVMSNLRQIWSLFLLLLGGSLAIASILSLALHRSLTRPIHELAHSLKRYQPGKTPALPENGPDEIAQLSRSFNEMAARVADEIARREQLEFQIAQTQRQESLGRLAGSIAHDFNNIIGAIGSLTELALEEDSVEQRQQDLNGILDAVAQGLQLTHQLTLFAGKGEQLTERLILDEQWERWRKPLQALFSQSILLEIVPGAGAAEVKIAQNRLFQVLLNLCVNARDALMEARREGTVTISSTADAHRVFIEVKDDGPGIPLEVQPRVFEPFFTTKPQGTGVGLASSYGIVVAAGGTIRLAGTEPGEGTTFVVELPRQDTT